MLGVRPDPDRVAGRGRSAVRRRRCRQDPTAHRAARPGRRRRAGRCSPATASTSATARCPTSRSPRCSAGWPSTFPTWSAPSPASTRRSAGSSPAAGCSAPTRPATARPSTGPTCSRRCTSSSRRPPRRRRCCWSSRTPTGPTSRPATCSASCSPGPSTGRSTVVASYRSDDLHRRHPLRTQVAEWSRIRGVERLQLQPLTAPDVRTLIHELHPDPIDEDDVADIVEPGRGQRVLRRGARRRRVRPRPLGARRARRRAAGPPRPARRPVPAGGARGQRRGPPGLPRHAQRGLRPRRRTASTKGLRQAVEMNILLAHEQRYLFRHALLGEAVYDDLLPGERVRLHKAYAEALSQGRARGTAAELARHARLAMDLPTALSASIRAGDEAIAVGGPDEAAHHYQQALELLADPRRAAGVRRRRLQAGGQGRRGADRQRAPDPRGRAAQGAARPAPRRRRPRTPGPDAVGPRQLPDPDRDRRGPGRCLRGGGRPGPRPRTPACGPRSWSPTPGSWPRWPATRRPRWSASTALELAERLDLNELASDAITTLSQLKKAGPKEGLRAALIEAVARAEKSGALERRAPRAAGCSAAPTRTGRSSTRPRSGSTAPSSAARRPGIPWAPYAFESRWQLTWVAMTRGEWDRVLELTDVPGQAPPVSARAAGRRAPRRRRRPGARRRRPSCSSCAATGTRRAASPSPRPASRWCWPGAGTTPRPCSRSTRSVVEEMSQIWHPWFSARIRLAAMALGALAGTVPSMAAAERPTYVEAAERLLPRRAHRARALHRPVRLLGSRGPGLGQAAGRRAAADALAVRRRRPAGRRARRHLARDGRDVRGLRRRLRDRPVTGRAGRDPARHRRPGRRPARSATRRGRPPAGSVPSPCSTSSARSGRRRPAATPPPTRSPRASGRSWRWSPRAGPTARSASSSSSAPRPSASTSPTSSASSTPPAAPRPPRSRVAGGCSTDPAQ